MDEIDDESRYNMLDLPDPAPEGMCTRKVKSAIVIALVASLCVILILTIIVPLSEGESTHRKVYIACEQIPWDYTPYKKNMIENRPFTPKEESYSDCYDGCANALPYSKTVYRQYTNHDFDEEMEHDESLGIMGPVIYAKVDDQITLFLKNNLLDDNCGIVMHGLKGIRSQEADAYVTSANEEEGDPVTSSTLAPGETGEYKYEVPTRAGPASNELSSRAWIYHGPLLGDHPSLNEGLFGMLVISGQYSSKEDGKPNDVDHEVFVALSDFDESSAYWGDESSENSTVRHTINGYMYGNTPAPFSIPLEGITRWYVTSTGFMSYGHSIFWHGNSINFGGVNRDVMEVPTMYASTVDMEPDSVGTWLISSTDFKRSAGGMMALYEVASTLKSN